MNTITTTNGVFATIYQNIAVLYASIVKRTVILAEESRLQAAVYLAQSSRDQGEALFAAQIFISQNNPNNREKSALQADIEQLAAWQSRLETATADQGAGLPWLQTTQEFPAYERIVELLPVQFAQELSADDAPADCPWCVKDADVEPGHWYPARFTFFASYDEARVSFEAVR